MTHVARVARVTLALAVVAAGHLGLAASSPRGASRSTADQIAAKDLEAIGAVIDALYETISGPAGQARDWTRFRSLFLPTARLAPTFVPEGSDEILFNSSDLDSYVASTGRQMERRGLFKTEIGRQIVVFDNIAHVFSAYESRLTADGPLMAHGVQSIQLLWDGKRWAIVNLFWRNGGPGLEIPSRFLTKGG